MTVVVWAVFQDAVSLSLSLSLFMYLSVDAYAYIHLYTYVMYTVLVMAWVRQNGELINPVISNRRATRSPGHHLRDRGGVGGMGSNPDGYL